MGAVGTRVGSRVIPPQLTSRAGSILLAATGVFIGLCLLTYSPADTALLSSHPQHPAHNLGGAIGTWVGFLGRAAQGEGAHQICAERRSEHGADSNR